MARQLSACRFALSAERSQKDSVAILACHLYYGGQRTEDVRLKEGKKQLFGSVVDMFIGVTARECVVVLGHIRRRLAR